MVLTAVEMLELDEAYEPARHTDVIFEGRDVPLLMRVPEAAIRCAVSRVEAYNMVARGDWAHVRVGKQKSGVRVVYASILAWIERERRTGYEQGEIDMT